MNNNEPKPMFCPIDRTLVIENAYNDYAGSLLAYLICRTKRRDEAEDILQNTFLRLLEGDNILRVETVKYYLYSTARNLFIDYLRRRACHARHLELYYDYAPKVQYSAEHSVDAAILEAEETKHVALMPQRMARVYLLYRFSDKNADEISATLQLSKRTVENHIYHARRQLKQALRECI